MAEYISPDNDGLLECTYRCDQSATLVNDQPLYYDYKKQTGITILAPFSSTLADEVSALLSE